MVPIRKIAVFVLAASFLFEALVPCCPDYAKYETEIYSGTHDADSAIILQVPQNRNAQLNQNAGSINICTAEAGLHCILPQTRRHLRLSEINASAHSFSASLLGQGCLLQI